MSDDRMGAHGQRRGERVGWGPDGSAKARSVPSHSQLPFVEGRPAPSPLSWSAKADHPRLGLFQRLEWLLGAKTWMVGPSPTMTGGEANRRPTDAMDGQSKKVLMRRRALATALALLATPAIGAPRIPERDRYFSASDGTRLHFVEAGPAQARTIVLIPGWTMPAWIWEAQIQSFARKYRTVAFDPRGQGGSDVPARGYDHVRRGQDIAELISHLAGPKPLIVAWSLGVLDTLAYVHTRGDSAIAGLVLVDNSVGEDPPPPVPPPATGPVKPPPPHAEEMRRFVASMFRTKRDQAWLDRLTKATLRTPEDAARKLLAYPVPRTYWREATHATSVPLLYAIRPRWQPQAENLARAKAGTEIEVFPNAGHALFVDEPERFDSMVESFARRRVWP